MSARYPVMHYTSQQDSLKFCLLRTNQICLKVRRSDICVFKTVRLSISKCSMTWFLIFWCEWPKLEQADAD